MAQAMILAPSRSALESSELKAHLRIEGNEEDLYLQGLAREATDHLEAVSGKKLILQTWSVYFDSIPKDGMIELPSAPLSSVRGTFAYDENGNRNVIPPSGIEVDKASHPPRIRFLSIPGPGRSMNGIEIQVVYGYATSSRGVPPALRRALLQLCAHWYELRGSGVDGAAFGLEPKGFRRLIQPFRSVNL